MARKALLIGVIDYENEALSSINDTARHDVEILAESLEIAGYPSGCISKDVKNHGKSAIRKRVREFMSTAMEQDDLLVYFSGHGVEYQGRRFLVPYDYDIEGSPGIDELVDEYSLYAFSRDSKANSVTFFIDACRESVNLTLTSGNKSVELSPEKVQEKNTSPSVSFIYSCASGCYSHWSQIEKGKQVSFFALALASTFKEEGNSPPSILKTIIANAQMHLDQISLLQDKGQQITVSDLLIVGRGGEPLSTLLREDAAASFLSRVEKSEWCKHIKGLPLWKKTFQQEECHPLVLQCFSIVLASESIITKEFSSRKNNWSQNNSITKVLDRMNMLTEAIFTNSDSPISPSEVILLVCTPFVHESILSLLEAKIKIDFESDNNNNVEPCKAMSNWVVFKSEELSWERHAKLLEQKEMQADADDIRWRMFYLFSYQAGELWTYSPKSGKRALGWVNFELDTLFQLAPFASLYQNSQVEKILDGKMLVEMARLLISSPEELSRLICDSKSDSLLKCIEGGEGDSYWCCTPLRVLPLLVLSSRLALDPRRINSAVAEHIGLEAGWNLALIQKTLKNAVWRTSDSHDAETARFSLSLECPNQVLDFALEKEVIELNSVVQCMQQSECISHFYFCNKYLAFDDKKLIPIITQGTDVYSRPHVKFGLDERKTMGLLMGTQLYGNAQLAIRELYQNAIDACRYRRARDKYEREKGNEHYEYIPTFNGCITLTAGYEKSSHRAYIECLDNGVGMGESHLSKLFAHGGKRFAESHEFQVERASWALKGIDFYPNSRFGVGVLSYFMLADQIEVETSRLDKDGLARGPLLSINILGSNSIFQLRTKKTNGPLEHGTKIRLYINDGDPDEILHSVKSWLAIPEFNTNLCFSTDEDELLKSGVYIPHYRVNEFDSVLPVEGSECQYGVHRMYWLATAIGIDRYHHFEGDILVDGIRIINLDKKQLEDLVYSQQRAAYPIGFKGMVINLKDEYEAKLSVDRTQLLNEDEIRTIINTNISEKGINFIKEWNEINLDSLSVLAEQQPYLADKLDKEITSLLGKKRMLVKLNNDQLTDLCTIGISPLDLILFNPEKMMGHNAYGFDCAEHANAIFRPRLSELYRASVPLNSGFKVLGKFDCDKNISHMSAGTLVLLSFVFRQYVDVKSFDIHIIFDFYKQYKVPLTEIAKLAEPLIKLEYSRINKIILDAIIDNTINEKHSIFFLGHNISERSNNGLITIADLSFASIKCGKTISEIFDLFEPLIDLGLTNVSHDTLVQLRKLEICNDLYIFFTRRIANFEKLTLSHLIPHANRHSADFEKSIEQAEKFIGLGLTNFSKEQLNLFQKIGSHTLLRDMMNSNYSSENSYINIEALIYYSAKTGIPISTIVELVAPYKELGLVSYNESFEGKLLKIKSKVTFPMTAICTALTAVDKGCAEFKPTNVKINHLLFVICQHSITSEECRELVHMFFDSESHKDVLTIADGWLNVDSQARTIISKVVDFNTFKINLVYLAKEICTYSVKEEDLIVGLNLLSPYCDVAEAVKFINFWCHEKDKI